MLFAAPQPAVVLHAGRALAQLQLNARGARAAAARHNLQLRSSSFKGQAARMAANGSSAPAALIFDCDGTVIDSMPIFFWENSEVCRMHGIKLTKERFYSLAGMPIKEIYVLLAAEQGVAIDIDAVVADKKRLHAQAPLPATISPVEAIIRAHHGKVPLAVASSGTRANVTHHLAHVGLLPLFDAVVTCEDVARGKPAPDLFLEAARRLGVPPERCRAYEDADLGLEAIAAAGMEAVDVRRLPGYPLPFPLPAAAPAEAPLAARASAA